MANKNRTPGLDERDDFVPGDKPGQSGTTGSEGGGTGTNRGVGRPEDLGKDRTTDRDLDDEIRSSDEERGGNR